jgi:hypothetical protein
MKSGQIARQVPWGALVWSLAVLACQSLPEAASHKDHSESSHEIEMANEPPDISAAGRGTVPDDETLRRFEEDYFSAGSRKRPVFDKYLGRLQAEAILAFLESTYPQCHSQAHELGQSIFARFKEIGAAFGQCKTRCTTGCMHGVLVEAFQKDTFENITVQLADFCKDDMTSMYKPGNCAHGSGHALMIVTDYDIAEAITGCLTFLEPAMQYYCSTGAFMEYLLEGEHRTGETVESKSIHFPCDTYTQFPAACYRYHTSKILDTFDGDMDKVVQECLALPRQQRLGCFHGLGRAYKKAIGEEPALLAEVCRYGTLDDQIICIEGAIEKLSDYDKQAALSACGSLGKEKTSLCRAAAEEQMYRLHKATMGLYTGQGTHPGSP